MKNFVRLNITDTHILDEVSFFVKCHVDFIWLVVPSDFPRLHLIQDILSISDGETEVWIESEVDYSKDYEIDGLIAYEIIEDSAIPWAGVATNLASFKNLELAGASFILIDYHHVFAKQKADILGSEGLHTIFEEESYGWSVLTANTPIFVYGKLSKTQTLSIHESKLIEGYEIN